MGNEARRRAVENEMDTLIGCGARADMTCSDAETKQNDRAMKTAKKVVRKAMADAVAQAVKETQLRDYAETQRLLGEVNDLRAQLAQAVRDHHCVGCNGERHG